MLLNKVLYLNLKCHMSNVILGHDVDLFNQSWNHSPDRLAISGLILFV